MEPRETNITGLRIDIWSRTEWLRTGESASENQEGEFDRGAWERCEVGIWYGAWSAEDFISADVHDRTTQAVADLLNNLPAQQRLTDGAWCGDPIPGSYINPARRFFHKVQEGDWAVLYLRAKGEELSAAIALAQMGGVVYSDNGHLLNTRAGEILKYRKIHNRKAFLISQLPDAYRLLIAALPRLRECPQVHCYVRARKAACRTRQCRRTHEHTAKVAVRPELEGALEFGGALDFDIGVASGGVYVMAGAYFKISNAATTLEGYWVRLLGSFFVYRGSLWNEASSRPASQRAGR